MIIISFGLIPILLTVKPAPSFATSSKMSVIDLYRASPLALIGNGLTGMAQGTLVGLGAIYASEVLVDDGEVTWEPIAIDVTTDPRTGRLLFDGKVGAMTFGNDQQVVAIDGLSIKGQQTETEYGFHVGDVDLAADRAAPLDVVGDTDKTGTTVDRKSTRLNSSHSGESRMPSSA